MSFESPREAVQTISPFDGQVLCGQPLKVRVDRDSTLWRLPNRCLGGATTALGLKKLWIRFCTEKEALGEARQPSDWKGQGLGTI